MTNIELEIENLKRKSDKLIEEMQIITNSEERNRSLITKLKITYRELQAKFERCIKEYGDARDAISKLFDQIDNDFQLFENSMDQNDYVEVEKIVIVIEDEIDNLKNVLNNLPSIVLMASVLIPGKIEEAKVMYARMIRDGYPLDYLNVDYNLEEISKKTTIITESLKKLDVNIKDVSVELKTMVDYFDNLFGDFDKEKESKDLFKEGCKKFRLKIDKVNKVVYDIYIQIDDIKVTYDLTEEEINRFSLLNKNLEVINEDFKSLLEHGKTKTFAYSKLNDELDGLSLKLSRLQDDLDYQLRSITSMKDDEYRAKEQLSTIQELLKKAKYKLKDYKLPVIPSSYYVELKEAQDAIKEIVRELEKKPIVIKILNIRVDTARDLVFKIYNKTNDMIKASQMSEDMIIYGNRYRSTYPEVEEELDKAITLFYKGQYEQSLKISMNAINLVEDISKKN
jgi:septation ring formation regulator